MSQKINNRSELVSEMDIRTLLISQQLIGRADRCDTCFTTKLFFVVVIQV